MRNAIAGKAIIHIKKTLVFLTATPPWPVRVPNSTRSARSEAKKPGRRGHRRVEYRERAERVEGPSEASSSERRHVTSSVLDETLCNFARQPRWLFFLWSQFHIPSFDEANATAQDGAEICEPRS